MLHLVICAAWISASVNVTLFEQLWKTSSRESSHAAHMLFSFCHYLSSNCLHLPSGSSPVHHSPPLRTSLPPLLSSPHLHLSPAQISPTTCPWTTSPSRSSCWRLGCPQPASAASPLLPLLCGGAAVCSPWRSCCSCLVPTDCCSLRLYPGVQNNVGGVCGILTLVGL